MLGLLSQAQTPAPAEVEVLGPDSYRLTVTVVGTTDPGQGQARLLPKANELCGGAGFTFGRYQFDATEPGRGETRTDADLRITYRQELRCGAQPSSPTLPDIDPITDADASRMQPAILTLSDTYFSAIDDRRDAESLAMTLPSMTGDATLVDWAAGQARRRAEVGRLTSRTVAKLTWYSNPPDVDPGLYVAADFVAYSENADECGYLVWFSPTGEPPFRLARAETTTLPHTLDVATVPSLRQQYCIIL